MRQRNSTYQQDRDTSVPVISEQEIEDRFIEKLRSLKYTYRPDIQDLDSLEANFRAKFDRLNAVSLSDSEFARLLDQITTPDVYKAARLLRSINSFERDDGTPLNFTLVNLKDWCKNDFEVVSQLRINTRSSFHRYDVLLLINGLPCVQIELKTLEISPRRAMQQIVDYKADPGNGYTNTLLCFMQLFIVSNRTNTYYFANNNARHFSFDAKENFLPVYQFADRDNNKITHLDRFAEAFLPKCTLGHMISRYMVLVANEQKLLMMRPYQIYAVKDIVDCIQQNSGNGYIWHTTGSGKTLTSFKASTLLKDNPDIEKCLFVVDRKDLDRQTREEFNKFQEGCVEENTNTHTLVERLLSDNKADKVIVTTIQKLGLALDANSKRNIDRRKRRQQTYKEILAPLAHKRVAIIFDECHRSQFGDNHKAIKDFFPESQLFGFTGTSIFEENATVRQIDGQEATYRTTEDVFAQELHQYTITHAIEDRNVLKFHVDYFKVAGASSSNSVEGASSSPAQSIREQDAPATWEFFNPLTEIDIRTGGNLPHWEQGSVWYFVTFRLADALPKAVVEKLQEERAAWKRAHDLENLTREENAEYHRLFSERYEALLNAGSGSCVLRAPAISRIVRGALHYFQGERYELDEYIIMPNHVHVLVKPTSGHRLVDILHSWKSFTANEINKRLKKSGQLWQHESYDHIVRHERAMHAIRRYIRENPKVAGASSSLETVAGASSSFPDTKASETRETREQDAPATVPKNAVIEAILDRHDQTTAGRKFNALFATASINDAIAYHELFAEVQREKQAADPDFRPLHVACVFSPPAEGDADIKQLQEDLEQENADNREQPDKKKKALKAIIAAYNARYGTNHRITEFDAYYQDVQQRIKAQRFPAADLRKAEPKAPAHKIDITIVVDMLLTGFDSKYLNTLYVDKKLKYHGLIQAFSRTNRVLNDSKPHGHILDFRQQQDAVDEAIRMFSGRQEARSKEIWLVDPAPTVIEDLGHAVRQLDDFMKSQGLTCAPEDVPKLQGDAARAQFIKTFKEVQRLKTQLDQYTDLDAGQKAAIENVLPAELHRGFKGVYIDTARKLKKERDSGDPGAISPEIDELDFEFVLFASATIDYDYIMELLAKSDSKEPQKQKMTPDQLVSLIASDANFAEQRELLESYIRQLDLGQGRTKEEILEGYEAFKDAEENKELHRIAQAHGLAPEALRDFTEEILRRLVFDGERLTDLMAPLELGWKDRRRRELALMKELVPLLQQRANGQEISGLAGYEH